MRAWAIVKKEAVSNYACDPSQLSLRGTKILLIATSEKETRKIIRLYDETIQ